jgi:hypothetical protein
MPRMERQRRARVRPKREKKRGLLKLIESLAPHQLELFRQWKSNCIDKGIPCTPYDKMSFISELLAA